MSTSNPALARPMSNLSTNARRASWAGQIVAAAIIGMTLFFKFSAAPESVALFTELGVEPWGRLSLGTIEAIAVALLLIPRTAVFGGLLAAGLMVGAVGTHVFLIGINFGGDASLFGMAIVALLASSLVVLLRRRELPILGH